MALLGMSILMKWLYIYERHYWWIYCQCYQLSFLLLRGKVCHFFMNMNKYEQLALIDIATYCLCKSVTMKSLN